MKSPIIVLVAGLALAGCQVKPSPVATVPQAPVDAKIAAVSQELAQYCATAQMGIVLVRALNLSNKPEVRKSLAAAEAARAAFCASPPTDTVTAIGVMAAIATDVITVWKANS